MTGKFWLLSQIQCLPSEQIDSRFNKRLSFLITEFSRFSKINYNSNRNLLKCSNMSFLLVRQLLQWPQTQTQEIENKQESDSLRKQLKHHGMNNKQELSCLNTLNFYGSLRLQLSLSRSSIEVKEPRYFVFNWTMNVKLD